MPTAGKLCRNTRVPGHEGTVRDRDEGEDRQHAVERGVRADRALDRTFDETWSYRTAVERLRQEQGDGGVEQRRRTHLDRDPAREGVRVRVHDANGEKPGGADADGDRGGPDRRAARGFDLG